MTSPWFLGESGARANRPDEAVAVDAELGSVTVRPRKVGRRALTVLDERFDRAEQVAERDAAVDREPFDLMEHVRMGRIDAVTSVHAPRRQHEQRQRRDGEHDAGGRRRQLSGNRRALHKVRGVVGRRVIGGQFDPTETGVIPASFSVKN